MPDAPTALPPRTHFSDAEFARRNGLLAREMERRGLDGMLIFAPESQYWLTGHDTFGYCFFQCLVVGGAAPALLTRSADLRQAERTSTLRDIRVWRDGVDADPAADLAAMLDTLGLTGKRLGIETNTHGLTAANHIRLTAALDGHATLVEASDLVSTLRLVKSEEELACVRTAATLADEALDAALDVTSAGADEAHILAHMQGAVFQGGGDYPGNPFIIGSGPDALLCRYRTGRRSLDGDDQLTLEWAGVYRHYHAAMMRTLVVGAPDPAHLELHTAAQDALLACEAALRPGDPMSRVFDAHASVLDTAGLGAHRLNACGYALGARFAPSWMEDQMFYDGAPTVMAPGMVFFLHMILMDSARGKAMCLGRTSVITGAGAEPLSRHGTELLIC
ncbi:M24 family metallopeptidase [Oceanomicrobium pacificus]|uniref:M24 family metallopeptidase n=1 Tax=Oceanomicrobium pacificus TaxID=2692916 RepID=A0A6B0TNQ9_9RHOB|nr:Xaa-Pro peptidase family protein [Oceanomicrobium pacificus]MXU64219.1 M24 family metallopeptidase [Oceanomicrobium pacificus]